MLPPLLSLLAGPLVFAGGTMGDLGRTLADWSQRPVVALVEDSARIRPFEIGLSTVGDGKDLTRLLRVKAKRLAAATEGTIGLSGRGWGEPTVESTLNPIAAPTGMTVVDASSKWLQGKRVTIRLKPGEVVRVADLIRLPWSRPVEAHWFAKRLLVVPTASGVTEEAFLRALAAASATKFEASGGRWSLGLDARAFRSRALVTVEERPPEGDTPELAALDHTLCVEAWRTTTEADIRQVFAAPNQMGGWKEVRNPAWLELARRYLAAQRAFVKSAPAGMESVTAAVGGLLDQIAFDRPILVGVGQHLGATFAWPRQGSGRVII